jgi:hypothetical protein
MTKIDIGIDNSGVACSPGGGHFRGHKSDKIVWASTHYTFSLHFALLTGKGQPSWPFQESPKTPHSGVKHFEGTLELADPHNPPAYKYTVVIDGYVPLDPIIIVDD